MVSVSKKVSVAVGEINENEGLVVSVLLHEISVIATDSNTEQIKVFIFLSRNYFFITMGTTSFMLKFLPILNTPVLPVAIFSGA